jgi:molybdate transport system regulatory protein
MYTAEYNDGMSKSPVRRSMNPPHAARASSAHALPPADLRFRIRVLRGDAIAVGPGKVAVLEAVEATGSITAAAKALGMSYRRAWLLVDELNRSLCAPAVESAKGGERGGASSLTPTGRRLVELYRRIERDAERACRAQIDELMALLATR